MINIKQCKSTNNNFLYFLVHNPFSLFTMTSWCHLDFSSNFAVIPNTFLLYKLSAYRLSGSYISWLHCYVTSGYVSSESRVFIQYPLKCFLFFAKDLPLGSNDLCITALSKSLKHSVFSVCWHYQNCSFHKLCNWQNTSTIWHWFQKSEVQCWPRIVLIKQNVGTHVFWPTLLLLLIVSYCYITPQLVLSNNMPHLTGLTLWMLMSIGCNTSNRNVQLHV
jgi:hypothetical protein